MEEFEGYVFDETQVSIIYTPEEDILYALNPENSNIVFDSSGRESIDNTSLEIIKAALLISMSEERLNELASNDERIIVTLFLSSSGEVLETTFRLRKSVIENSIITSNDLDNLSESLKGLVIEIPSAFIGSEGYPQNVVIIFDELI